MSVLEKARKQQQQQMPAEMYVELGREMGLAEALGRIPEVTYQNKSMYGWKRAENGELVPDIVYGGPTEVPVSDMEGMRQAAEDQIYHETLSDMYNNPKNLKLSPILNENALDKFRRAHKPQGVVR